MPEKFFIIPIERFSDFHEIPKLFENYQKTKKLVKLQKQKVFYILKLILLKRF